MIRRIERIYKTHKNKIHSNKNYILVGALGFDANATQTAHAIPSTKTTPIIDTMVTFDGTSKNPSTGSWSAFLTVTFDWLETDQNVEAVTERVVEEILVTIDFVVNNDVVVGNCPVIDVLVVVVVIGVVVVGFVVLAGFCAVVICGVVVVGIVVVGFVVVVNGVVVVDGIVVV